MIEDGWYLSKERGEYIVCIVGDTYTRTFNFYKRNCLLKDGLSTDGIRTEYPRFIPISKGLMTWE